AFADRKFFTKEELEQQKIAKVRGFRTVISFAPVEDVGLGSLDHIVYVEDLRTSLITYPDNGKLPRLRDGIQREPQVEQIFALAADLKNGPPPALLALLGGFGGGTKDSYQDLSPSARCLVNGPTAPIVPDISDNYIQIIQSRDQIALLTDADGRIASL